MNKNNNSQHEAPDLRSELYKTTRKRVQDLLGENERSLKVYEKAYLSTFNRYKGVVSTSSFRKSLRAAELVIVGDFHALHQSQKAFLRILNLVDKTKPPVIALECFEVRHQKTLDEYMKGKISEKDFLRAIEWRRHWGFPWENYRGILRWAMKHKAPVLALNKATGPESSRDLVERDNLAAQVITQAAKKFPGQQIVALYGDWHLAENHLLGKIKNRSVRLYRKSCVIYQNSEPIYFDLVNKNAEIADIVEIKPMRFCLLNVPPWVKWQSYLFFLEQSQDLFHENISDPTDDVINHVRILSQLLEVKVDVNDINVIPFWDQPQLRRWVHGLPPSEKKWIQTLIKQNVSFYWPDGQVAYLANLSTNHLSLLAMSAIYFKQSNSDVMKFNMPQKFTHWIWMEAIHYFGSKLLNPKRKTDTILDLKTALLSQETLNLKKDAMKLALQHKMKELLFLTQRQKPSWNYMQSSLVVYREAARLLGGMLGEKIFHGYFKKRISLNVLKKKLFFPVSNDNFQDFYLETLEWIESLPEPFKTKKDKL